MPKSVGETHGRKFNYQPAFSEVWENYTLRFQTLSVVPTLLLIHFSGLYTVRMWVVFPTFRTSMLLPSARRLPNRMDLSRQNLL
jgi:hypothetical protein